MKETSWVHWCTILFWEAADELNWPNSVLHWLYYNSLPDHIKDLWARTNLPSDFEDLVCQAQYADNHYWKCIGEKKKSDTRLCASEQKSPSETSSSTQQSDTNQRSSSSSYSHPCASTSSQSQSSAPSTSQSTSNTWDLSTILGPNGKLLHKEKAHCERLSLCSYCSKDHPPLCELKPKPKEGLSSNNSSSTPLSSSQSNSNSSNSKPKGCAAHIIDLVSEESDHDSSSDQ